MNDPQAVRCLTMVTSPSTTSPLTTEPILAVVVLAIGVACVGFFGYHWQPGADRNGFELHSVITIEFLD